MIAECIFSLSITKVCTLCHRKRRFCGHIQDQNVKLRKLRNNLKSNLCLCIYSDPVCLLGPRHLQWKIANIFPLPVYTIIIIFLPVIIKTKHVNLAKSIHVRGPGLEGRGSENRLSLKFWLTIKCLLNR